MKPQRKQFIFTEKELDKALNNLIVLPVVVPDENDLFDLCRPLLDEKIRFLRERQRANTRRRARQRIATRKYEQKPGIQEKRNKRARERAQECKVLQ